MKEELDEEEQEEGEEDNSHLLRVSKSPSPDRKVSYFMASLRLRISEYLGVRLPSDIYPGVREREREVKWF